MFFGEPHLLKLNGISIVAGNSQTILLIGFGIFVASISSNWIYHDFDVVNDLPSDVVIGGEIMREHHANLRYLPNGSNSIKFKPECGQCIINKNTLRKLRDYQLKYTQDTEKAPRNFLLFRRAKSSYVAFKEPLSEASADKKLS